MSIEALKQVPDTYAREHLNAWIDESAKSTAEALEIFEHLLNTFYANFENVDRVFLPIAAAQVARIYHTHLNGELKTASPEEKNQLFQRVADLRRAEKGMLIPYLKPYMLQREGQGIDWPKEFDQDYARTLQHMGNYDAAEYLLKENIAQAQAELAQQPITVTESTEPILPQSKDQDVELLEAGIYWALAVLFLRLAENKANYSESKEDVTALGIFAQGLDTALEADIRQPNPNRSVDFAVAAAKALKNYPGTINQKIQVGFLGMAEVARITFVYKQLDSLLDRGGKTGQKIKELKHRLQRRKSA